MIKIFNIRITTQTELDDMWCDAYDRGKETWKNKQEPENTYHCGQKSCQFHTTSPAGLSIHRAKAHK